MSDTNEQIALEKGWTNKGLARLVGLPCWLRPGGQSGDSGDWFYNPPNFSSEWEHNGPLQVELWEAGFELSHDNVDGTFYWYEVNEYGTPLDDDMDDTTDVMLATAMDWLAWKTK